MAFKLDTSDMERHKVELRLFVEKALRRFTKAEMLDDFRKILSAQMTNASEKVLAKENFEAPDRLTPENTDQLANFLFCLSGRCRDASDRELLQESLRRALVRTRQDQQASGATIDAMCLFCMGHFSSNQMQCAPPLFSSTPYRANDGEQNDDRQSSGEQQRPLPGPPPPESQDHANGFNEQPINSGGGGGDHMNGSQFQQERNVRPIEYQPQFRIPPTPDEDVAMECNDLSPPTNDCANNNNNRTPGHAPDDSMTQWFIEGNRHQNEPANSVPRLSSPLTDFIESQKKLLEQQELELARERQRQDFSDQIDQVVSILNGTQLPNGTDKDGTISNNDKKQRVHQVKKISRSSLELGLAKVAERGTALVNGILNGGGGGGSTSSLSQQPASAIDRDVRDAIRRAQVSSTQVTASPNSTRDRMSNSKQFIKHRTKGRRRKAPID